MLTGKARLELDDLDNARADLEQAAGVLAANDPAAYPERSRIEADLTRVLRLAGDIDAALTHGDREVEFGKLAMAATGDAPPYITARISSGETTCGREDGRASGGESMVSKGG